MGIRSKNAQHKKRVVNDAKRTTGVTQHVSLVKKYGKRKKLHKFTGRLWRKA